jgi:hypothetical protein
MDPTVLKGLLALGYGENVEIPYDELHVPEEFQRALKPRNWDTFVPALFGRAVVAEVDGENWLVDGLHRVDEGHTHGMWAEANVPSVLYAGSNKEQAAGLFHLSNARRVALRAADEFRSACYSGDESARALDVALLDLDLDGWCQGRAERDLTAVGTVVGIAEKYGMEHALYTLDTLRDIWAWDDKADERYAESAPHMRTIKGFSEYLRPVKNVTGRRYPRRWDPENGEMLTTYIATHFPGQEGLLSFLARAQMKRAGKDGGGASAVGVELQIHDCFLKAKRERVPA